MAEEVVSEDVPESSTPSGEATVFVVHYVVSVVDDPCTLKLTLKPGALGKPFGKKVVEPFLKHMNAKLGEKEQVAIGDLEKVLIGPGTRLSDKVTDLSASVSSVTPDDVDGEARVDLIPRKKRNVRLVCSGVQLDVTVPAELVHVPLSHSIVPRFLTSLNDKCERQRIRYTAHPAPADPERPVM